MGASIVNLFLSGIVVVTERITGLIIFFSKVVSLSFSDDIYYGNGIVEVSAVIVVILKLQIY